MLVERKVKTDCEKCGFETEHYLLDYGDKPMLCRCVRCGHVKIHRE